MESLKTLINASKNIVFLGGAGVSTESGIPDFRSQDGLYSQKYVYPPETILSHDFFVKHTKYFYDFYRDKMLFLKAEPNAAHIGLANLEKQGKVKAIVTQNIDGLHQLAGSKRVLELHGSVHRNYCMDCGQFYEVEAIVNSEGIPKCPCGGIIKPDVVLYQEGLNEQVVTETIQAINAADMLIIGGTSLAVYPAASFVNYYKGNKLVLMNQSPTPMDYQANLIVREKIGQVFDRISIAK